MKTVILALVFAAAAFCQCGTNATLKPIGGGKQSCVPKSTLIGTDASGNVANGAACPGGATNAICAATQTQADNTTKVATTAYVDTGLSGKAAAASPVTVKVNNSSVGSTNTVNLNSVTGMAAACAVGSGQIDCTLTPDTSVLLTKAAAPIMIGVTVDGGGAPVTTGSKGYARVPTACTLADAMLLADQTGSVVIDVKRSTYAGFPTTTSLCSGGTCPTLSAAQNSLASTLTSWTTSLAADDVIEFVVNSAATLQRVALILKCNRQ